MANGASSRNGAPDAGAAASSAADDEFGDEEEEGEGCGVEQDLGSAAAEAVRQAAAEGLTLERAHANATHYKGVTHDKRTSRFKATFSGDARTSGKAKGRKDRIIGAKFGTPEEAALAIARKKAETEEGGGGEDDDEAARKAGSTNGHDAKQPRSEWKVGDHVQVRLVPRSPRRAPQHPRWSCDRWRLTRAALRTTDSPRPTLQKWTR